MLTWCLLHKLELALKHAFKGKALDKKAQEQPSSEFYLFKKETLKMAIVQNIWQNKWSKSILLQERCKGTRWATHQLDSTDVHIHNLAIMLVFNNEQIETTYNSTMKSERSKRSM